MKQQHYKYAATGNQSAKAMLDGLGKAGPHYASALMDVHVDLTGATAADVSISDVHGVVYSATGLSADTPAKMDSASVKRVSVRGPLTVTTTNVSGGDTTLTIHAFLK